MQPKLKVCDVCGKEKILWKSIPPTCKGCYYKHTHSYALTNGKKVKVYKIRPISETRAKQLAEYRIVRDKYLKEHPICEYPGCNKTNITLHHKKGRIRALLCDIKHFCSLCHEHHRFVEENPLQAKIMRLSENRL